jgi:cytochrome c peroxidase
MPLFLTLFACSPEPAPEPSATDAPAALDSAALRGRASALSPLPAAAAESDLSRLGQQLYFDPRLSKADDIACNSCHLVDRYGVDGAATSTGHLGQVGGRNAPTVYNAGLHVAQFWDGRAATLSDQAKGPILNPIEMGMESEAQVMAKLSGIEGYQTGFAEAFPDQAEPMTYDNLATAIAAYEDTLLTPGRFDAWMAGDDAALTAGEQQGLATFLEVGCATCHMGPAIGGNQYRKLGERRPYDDNDMGRFEVTGVETDKQVFKVPSLRNIAETGPWFHDGSVTELETAIQLMGAHQLDQDLSAEQVAEIAAFLGALTGELPANAVAPELPAE